MLPTFYGPSEPPVLVGWQFRNGGGPSEVWGWVAQARLRAENKEKSRPMHLTYIIKTMGHQVRESTARSASLRHLQFGCHVTKPPVRWFLGEQWAVGSQSSRHCFTAWTVIDSTVGVDGAPRSNLANSKETPRFR